MILEEVRDTLKIALAIYGAHIDKRPRGADKQIERDKINEALAFVAAWPRFRYRNGETDVPDGGETGHYWVEDPEDDGALGIVWFGEDYADDPWFQLMGVEGVNPSYFCERAYAGEFRWYGPIPEPTQEV